MYLLVLVAPVSGPVAAMPSQLLREACIRSIGPWSHKTLIRSNAGRNGPVSGESAFSARRGAGSGLGEAEAELSFGARPHGAARDPNVSDRPGDVPHHSAQADSPIMSTGCLNLAVRGLLRPHRPNVSASVAAGKMRQKVGGRCGDLLDAASAAVGGTHQNGADPKRLMQKENLWRRFDLAGPGWEKNWRRGWDSNPRAGFTRPSDFESAPL